MSVCRKALLVIAASMTLAATASAQIRVMHFSDKNLPQRIVVQRGTIIEFGGDLPEEGLPVTFSLKCGAFVRASGQFQKKWLLQWDPAKEPTANCYGVLSRTDMGGQEVRLARISVQVVEGAPFKIGAPANYAKTDGAMALQVAPVAGVRMTGGEVLVDGRSRGAIDAKGAASVSLLGLKPGIHLVTAKVQMDGGGDFTTDAIHVSLNSVVAVSRNSVGPLDLTDRNAPTRVPLRVALPAEMKATSVEFFLDGKSFGTSTTAPFDDIALNPTGLPTGTHTVTVDVTTAEGGHHISPDLAIDVVGNVQNEYNDWITKLNKLLGQADDARASYLEAEQGWSSGQVDIGTYDISLRKLHGIDLGVSENLEKLVPPPSVPDSQKEQMRIALQEAHSAFRDLVTIDKAARGYVENVKTGGNPSLFRIWLGDHYDPTANRALLKIAGAKERIQNVEHKLAVQTGNTGDADLAQLLKYQVTGKGPQDFLSWKRAVDQVFAEDSAVKETFENAPNFAQKLLALRKVIAMDIWVSENIAKIVPPRSLSANLQQELGAALQTYGQAYGHRANGLRQCDKQWRADFGVGDRVDAGKVRIPESARALLLRFDLVSAQARERVNTVAKGLGVNN